MEKVEVIMHFQTLKKAFSRLKEAVNVAETELERDGVIQRFEFTFELFWKFLKKFLNYSGIDCYSPRNCIKTAFRINFALILSFSKERYSARRKPLF